MPELDQAPARICPNCDGFPAVAITLGGRNRHGHLRTVVAHCPACHGTGTQPLAASVREVARV
ncbi:hypothetical protein [Streptomyces apocyni]|uniref:hypothetical protein n=1 Tax=Streptomyces apocyni TaxID=2654677 RepID=UPI0012EA03D6|nr:hypothetical protein [Streptomyces apocyni]